MTTPLSLTVLPEQLAICQLAPTATIPSWARSQFCSITYTATELSVVCSAAQVPANLTDMKVESGWRALQVIGTLDFGLTGILAEIATPLAAAEISIFAISTYDTDYVLVKQETCDRAIEVLTQQGHQILWP
ncbi:MAG: ACT domain-containing protein [Thainema sp.]